MTGREVADALRVSGNGSGRGPADGRAARHAGSDRLPGAGLGRPGPAGGAAVPPGTERLVLHGGRVIDPGRGVDREADVYVEDGVIRGLEPPGDVPDGWRAVACAGRWVLPGLVDGCAHVPATEETWRDDAGSAADSALAGGFTTVVAVTGASRPEALQALAARPLPVRLAPLAALTRGGALAELSILAAAGAAGFSDDPRPLPDGGLARLAYDYAAMVGLPVAVLPLDVSLAAGGIVHEGPVATRLGLPAVPAAAEAAAVARDVLLCELTGVRLHFSRLSAARAVEVLRRAAERGLPVTAAVGVHHLVLTCEAVEGYDTAARLSPPLRAEEDRDALRRAVRDGLLSVVSDHRPVPPEEKDVEFDAATPGAVALEVALPLAVEAVGTDAVRALTCQPARAFGLEAGSLAPGAAADAVVFDAAAAWRVMPDTFRSVARNSPILGRSLRGRVVATLAAGRLYNHATDSIIVEAAGRPAGA